MALMYHSLRSRLFVYGVIFVGLGLLVGASAVSLKASWRLERSVEDWEGTHETLVRLHRLTYGLMEVEGWQRGYLMTGEAGYVLRMEELVGRFEGEMEALRQGVKGRAEKWAKLAELEMLVGLKGEEVGMIRRMQEAGEAEAAKVMMEEAGLMGKIRAVVDETERNEVAWFRKRAEQAGGQAERQRWLALLILGGGAGLAGVGGWFLSRRLHDLEEFITVCAWTKRVKYRGEWVPFEVYLEKHYGLKLSHGISEEAAQAELGREAVE